MLEGFSLAEFTLSGAALCKAPPWTPRACSSMASTSKEEKSNFRQRRLSLSDVDTSEFDKAGTSTPGAAPKRGRRLSMSPEMGVKVKPTEIPFPTELVGTFSCHGIEPSHREGETKSKINQDRGCTCYPFGPEEGAAGVVCPAEGAPVKSQVFFCVYDGHGALGDKVSHFVMNTVQELLGNHPALYSDPQKALEEAYVTTDDMLRKDRTIDAELSGTTAVTCLVRLLEDDSLHIWTAWAGDSRAVFAAKGGAKLSHDLSDDQKPDTPAEMARIRKAGGFVSPPEEEWGGPARVWLDANMTLPGLAMGRSIGDHLVKSVGVIAKPEVRHEVVGKGELVGTAPLIVLCSDGVWEFIESDDAINLINKPGVLEPKPGTLDATNAATKLIETAAAKWRQEEGDYRDDITAILVLLDPVKAIMKG